MSPSECSAQVRRKLVEEWLPVLVVCKDTVSPMSPYKALYVELEEIFLSIISTLPMSDSQELLPQCLNFSTRNVEDCPHLVSAFNTWFRRAAQSVKPDYDNNSDEWIAASVQVLCIWIPSMECVYICMYRETLETLNNRMGFSSNLFDIILWDCFLLLSWSDFCPQWLYS